MSSIYETQMGATFNGQHSFRDLLLFPLAQPDISTPEAKTAYVDLPAANGSLDLSEFLTGYPVFYRRQGSFRFFPAVDRSHWLEVYHNVVNLLHGRTARVIQDEEPDVYLSGRLAVSRSGPEETADIVISGDFDPYRYELLASDEDWLWDTFNFETGVIRSYNDIAISGSRTVTVVSSYAGGVPQVKVSGISGTLTLTIGTLSWSWTANGTYFLSGYSLPQSETEIEFNFSGTATVAIIFSPGRL